MEDNNNHIDDFAKKGVEGMNFEFKDAYWDEMEALLDDKKSKRGIIFWWVSGIASVLVLSLGFYFWDSHQQSNDRLALTNEVSQEKVEEKFNEEKEKTINSTIEQHRVESQSNDNLDKSDIIKSNIETKDDVSYNSTSVQVKKIDKQNNVSTVNSNSNSSSVIITVESSENLIELYEVADKNDANTENTENHTLLDEYIEPIEKRNISEINADDRQLSPVEVNGNAHYKSIHTNVEMIGGLGYGMNTTNNLNSIGGMNGSLGLQFNIEYGRFALQTGLNFGLNGIKGFHFKETKRIYGFSSQEVVNEINYNSMLSASIPVYIGYSGLKHSFSAGVKLNFMLNANGRVNTWNGVGNSSNSWGYSNALNNSWISCGANYFYKLNRRFSVGLMLDFDVTNRGENNVNDVQSDFRMWNAFVGLKYRLN